ncbi:hypothetical protein ACFV23_48190, partial [Streptomyces sp. NPDC059627]
MRGSEAVAEVLRREGVENVFCFPANKMIDTAAAVGLRALLRGGVARSNQLGPAHTPGHHRPRPR